jgi:hypothetical protein
MLKVYVVGLIYFDGCDQPQMRAYAPDGRDGEFTGIAHNASLWIRASQVVAETTNWGDRAIHVLDGVPFVEFRITTPSELLFPDENDLLSCTALDAAMPKLKKEKKKDDEEEDFEIDPANALTIARLTIRGGTVVPYEITNKNRSGLVEWRIENPSGSQITAGDRVITLAAGDAEVVFANMHDIPLDAKHDKNADDDHIQLFRQLMAPGLRNVVTLRPAKPSKLAEVSTENQYVSFLRMVKYSDGETPPCCARFVHVTPDS